MRSWWFKKYFCFFLLDVGTTDLGKDGSTNGEVSSLHINVILVSFFCYHSTLCFDDHCLVFGLHTKVHLRSLLLWSVKTLKKRSYRDRLADTVTPENRSLPRLLVNHCIYLRKEHLSWFLKSNLCFYCASLGLSFLFRIKAIKIQWDVI